MLKRAFALSDPRRKRFSERNYSNCLRQFDTDHSSKFVVDGSNDAFRKAAGTQVNVGRNIPFFVGITLVLFGMIAIAQLVQYNLTYTAAYKESANRRIVLAEKLRKLPLSFFEKKNLADLTTTIMGDCTALEKDIF